MISVIVSDEDLRFNDPLTVDAELEDTTLACFSCELLALLAIAGALFLRLIAPGDDVVEGVLLIALDSRGAGDTGAGGLFTGVLRDATELVETEERTDVDDVVRFAAGLSEIRSEGKGGGRLEALLDAAAEVGRGGRGVLGEVPVVLTLTVETVDAEESRLVLAPELGGISDLAVSNAVELSLVADNVDEGLETAEGGRSVEGPAVDFRGVEP